MCNEELIILMDMKIHIEKQIYCVNSVINFKEFLNEQKTPLLKNLIETYNLLDLKYTKDVNLLKSFLIEINKQIKAVCIHEYVEDYIDIDLDTSKKITYCPICYSTF